MDIIHSPLILTGLVISIHIANNDRHPLWLCELQKGFLKYSAEMGDLPEAADVYFMEGFNVKGSGPLHSDLTQLLEGCGGNISAAITNHGAVKKIGGSHTLRLYSYFLPCFEQIFLLFRALPSRGPVLSYRGGPSLRRPYAIIGSKGHLEGNLLLNWFVFGADNDRSCCYLIG